MRMCGFTIRICILAIAIVAVTLPALAANEDGVVAYKRGDFTVVLKEFRILADAEDRRAQYNIGGMYMLGRGVEKNYAEAIAWHLNSPLTKSALDTSGLV